jgi:hypothetical protein
MLGDDRSTGRLNGRRSGEQQRRVASWAPAAPSRAAREAAWRAGEGRRAGAVGRQAHGSEEEEREGRKEGRKEGKKEEERKEGKKRKEKKRGKENRKREKKIKEGKRKIGKEEKRKGFRDLGRF